LDSTRVGRQAEPEETACGCRASWLLVEARIPGAGCLKESCAQTISGHASRGGYGHEEGRMMIAEISETMVAVTLCTVVAGVLLFAFLSWRKK